MEYSSESDSNDDSEGNDYDLSSNDDPTLEITNDEDDEDNLFGPNYATQLYEDIAELLIDKSEANYENALQLNAELQRRLSYVRQRLLSLLGQVKKTYKYNEIRIQELSKRRPDGLLCSGAFLRGRTFYLKGNMFFKDENCRNCPNNDDYEQRVRQGEMFPMDFDLMSRHIWSMEDKKAIVWGIKEQAILQLKPQTNILSKENLEHHTLVRLLEMCGADFHIDWCTISAISVRYRHTANSCKAMWQVYLQPNLKKNNNWDAAERERLIKAVREHGNQNWQSIADEVGGRSDYQCFIMFNTVLRFTIPVNSTRWTKEDDERLLIVANSCMSNGVVNWSMVATQFPNRSKTTLQSRYAYSINPQISHAPFSTEEDILILAAVQEYGEAFKKIPRALFPNRSITQLRTRYHMALKNRHKHTAWTIEDDKILMNFVKEQGSSSWKQCAELFDNRHIRTSCRQRYNVIKKYLEKDPNMRLEDIKRKGYRQMNSVITPANWIEKMEEMRSNPDVVLKPIPRHIKRQQLEDADRENVEEACKSTKAKKSKCDSSTKNVEIAENIIRNVGAEHSTSVKRKRRKRSTRAAVAKKNSQCKLKGKLECQLQLKSNVIADKKNKSKDEERRILTACEVKQRLGKIGPIEKDARSAVAMHMRKSARTVFPGGLRNIGIDIYHFVKYAYNFRFGVDQYSNVNTETCQGVGQVCNALSFVNPTQAKVFKRYFKGQNFTPELRTQFKHILEMQSKYKFLDAGHLLTPSWSSGMALRAMCIYISQPKKDLTKEKDKNREAKVTQRTLKPTTNNSSCISGREAKILLRQRLRTLFFRTLLLSRLDPDQLDKLKIRYNLEKSVSAYSHKFVCQDDLARETTNNTPSTLSESSNGQEDIEECQIGSNSMEYTDILIEDSQEVHTIRIPPKAHARTHIADKSPKRKKRKITEKHQKVLSPMEVETESFTIKEEILVDESADEFVSDTIKT